MNIENHKWNEILEAAVTKSKIFMSNRRPVTDKREERKHRIVMKIADERGIYYVYRVKSQGKGKIITTMGKDLVMHAMASPEPT